MGWDIHTTLIFYVIVPATKQLNDFREFYSQFLVGESIDDLVDQTYESDSENDDCETEENKESESSTTEIKKCERSEEKQLEVKNAPTYCVGFMMQFNNYKCSESYCSSLPMEDLVDLTNTFNMKLTDVMMYIDNEMI